MATLFSKVVHWLRIVSILSFLLITLVVSITGCVSSSNDEDDLDSYLTGKELEDSGHPQGAIIMYSSSVHFGEISEKTLQSELSRLLTKLGKEAFDKALEEAYVFLKAQIKKGVESENQSLVRLNELAIGSLQAWEKMSGTEIWRRVLTNG